MLIVVITILSLALIALVLLLFKRTNERNILQNKYRSIINIDEAMLKRTGDMDALNKKYEGLNKDFDQKHEMLLKDLNVVKADFNSQKTALNGDFKDKKDIYEKLLNEIAALEENIELISYGHYKPHYNFDSSDEYKRKLEEIYESQKEAIKNEKATLCSTEWQVGGSKVEGRKMTKHYSKLMLRAFNGECDSAILKVRWNNIETMEARIEKAFEAINNLGASHHITVTDAYCRLKIDELRLEYEYQVKAQEEKEEQRNIKEQMREEEKVLREAEKVQEESEKEELRYQKALEKARLEIINAKDSEIDDLKLKLQGLEEGLKKAQEERERAVSRAQLTKSGHVYVISNIGSFGENVFKIGMTRRLEPHGRIKELGDASVPFAFDVHAMIYSENVPELENKLHRRLDDSRINLVNPRREFFKVPLYEIERVVGELGLNVNITKLAEAKEYRESKALKEAQQKSANAEVASKSEISKFPETLM